MKLWDLCSIPTSFTVKRSQCYPTFRASRSFSPINLRLRYQDFWRYSMLWFYSQDLKYFARTVYYSSMFMFINHYGSPQKLPSLRWFPIQGKWTFWFQIFARMQLFNSSHMLYRPSECLREKILFSPMSISLSSRLTITSQKGWSMSHSIFCKLLRRSTKVTKTNYGATTLSHQTKWDQNSRIIFSISFWISWKYCHRKTTNTG
jgi:hypothetical protein